ncbi:hypothetical protein H744_2c2842 [Photobacterium gaetbulicola Gung47]|uniref:MSP domain-containing protein n=2 Tax=Photobacterium gaetbulicola TaxID=1295392 RepID=A0A0C5X2C3_9GAMM|nr:hypothetical protein H744_2c2842 [Photobacterium gaetbulicola Gung47]
MRYNGNWKEGVNGNISIVQSQDLVNIIKSCVKLSFPNFTNSLSYQDIPFKKIKISNDTDLRLLWENERFDEFPSMAMNSSSDSKIKDHLNDWMSKNKPLHGINYISVMECSIRCLNLYVSLIVLKSRGNLSSQLEYQSYLFFKLNFDLIKSQLSLYSSRGNHTLFEYAGLYVCSKALCKSDCSFYANKFSEEFNWQVLPDGSGVEQSTAYHFFNIQLYYLMSFISNDISLSNSNFVRAAEFMSYFVVENKILRIGDSDSSKFSYIYDTFTDYLASMPDFSKLKHFKNSGLISMPLCNGGRLVFKYGRLGLPPLYGHGHYDFLSLYIISDYNVLLSCDSSTYLYNSKEREALRSSQYHSMPFFSNDDIKQSTSFSWDKSKSGFLKNIDQNFIHSFYQHDNGLITRKVFNESDYLIIMDYVEDNYDFSSQIMFLNESDDIKFFSYSLDNGLIEVDPEVSKIPFSKKYGSFEENQSFSYKIRATEKGMVLFTVYFYSSIDRYSVLPVLKRLSRES